MIDRVARNRAALLLRRFAAGRITNDDFTNEFPSSKNDPALRAVDQRAWASNMICSSIALMATARSHPQGGARSPVGSFFFTRRLSTPGQRRTRSCRSTTPS